MSVLWGKLQENLFFKSPKFSRTEKKSGLKYTTGHIERYIDGTIYVVNPETFHHHRTYTRKSLVKRSILRI